ncbi:hypothetical protein L873DRAFT_1801123 [Choiromyces venosus 120613-1]|uniref:Uncharacterized protein n=1 Tax=Choiromyces venosus 120613-1 TaxID=1336337 RepID=A0A3N4K139_9PEZI|nr:hypothetical protein L873DRAFT_1801123 [Choiromyces venosus 120613-1]
MLVICSSHYFVHSSSFTTLSLLITLKILSTPFMDHNHCIGVPTIIIDEVSELVSNLYQYDKNDCLMTDGNTWGDRHTIPTQPSTQSSHNMLS